MKFLLLVVSDEDSMMKYVRSRQNVKFVSKDIPIFLHLTTVVVTFFFLYTTIPTRTCSSSRLKYFHRVLKKLTYASDLFKSFVKSGECGFFLHSKISTKRIRAQPIFTCMFLSIRYEKHANYKSIARERLCTRKKREIL